MELKKSSYLSPSVYYIHLIIMCNHTLLLFLSPGRDVIAQAQSGTGKTATFAISILQSLDISKRACQALVLAPTRELAQQIQKVSLFFCLCRGCTYNNNILDVRTHF